MGRGTQVAHPSLRGTPMTLSNATSSTAHAQVGRMILAMRQTKWNEESSSIVYIYVIILYISGVYNAYRYKLLEN